MFTWYSAEQERARLLCHWASGTEVLSQRAERGRGCRIIEKSKGKEERR